MKINHFASLALSGLKAMLRPGRPPLLATIILTDRCNLRCRHCAVANQANTFSSYGETLELMHDLRQRGVKILFFCGGEVFLWRDGRHDIHDLVREARNIGFLIICVVTNGTISADIPGADLVFVSIDGMEETHNLIRGKTFGAIMANLQRVSRKNVVFYMAVNNINLGDIRGVTQLAKEIKCVKAVSFNFHTPYAGTEGLLLNLTEKQQAVAVIKDLIRKCYPIFNLPVGLEHYLSGRWDRPCSQCIVCENGRVFTCGRCSEIQGLCRECGYLFAVEFSLLLKGNIRAIREMLSIYLRYT